MTITPEQLAAWRELAEQATPGEWENVDGELLSRGEWGRFTLQAYNKVPTKDLVAHFRNNDDPAFIAAARTALPALLAEVERQRTRIADLERNLSSYWAAVGAVSEVQMPTVEAQLTTERDALREAYSAQMEWDAHAEACQICCDEYDPSRSCARGEKIRERMYRADNAIAALEVKHE